MHTDTLRPHALLDTPTATVHTDTLRPHALLNTPTATDPTASLSPIGRSVYLDFKGVG